MFFGSNESESFHFPLRSVTVFLTSHTGGVSTGRIAVTSQLGLCVCAALKFTRLTQLIKLTLKEVAD